MNVDDAKKIYFDAVAAQCSRLRNPPGDVVECEWPDCLCDPIADHVIKKLHENWAESYTVPCPVCGGPSCEATPNKDD